jgi:hypothetical protein
MHSEPARKTPDPVAAATFLMAEKWIKLADEPASADTIAHAKRRGRRGRRR